MTEATNPFSPNAPLMVMVKFCEPTAKVVWSVAVTLRVNVPDPGVLPVVETSPDWATFTQARAEVCAK